MEHLESRKKEERMSTAWVCQFVLTDCQIRKCKIFHRDSIVVILFGWGQISVSCSLLCCYIIMQGYRCLFECDAFWCLLSPDFLVTYHLMVMLRPSLRNLMWLVFVVLLQTWLLVAFWSVCTHWLAEIFVNCEVKGLRLVSLNLEQGVW
jgi:hypothetical protein